MVRAKGLRRLARGLRDAPLLLAVGASLWWTSRRVRRQVLPSRLGLHTEARPCARRTLPRESFERWLWRLDVASRFLPSSPSCLVRSLCLRRWLARAGQGTDLRIGVRRGDGGLEAHAWLEIEGTPIAREGRVASGGYRILGSPGT